ncbi:MAG: peptidoglycan DD-metalloendopeptidase family protein, partial [Clostridia bacterium]|nr:peptidoglycan DD-metalloendopeptidase family protein [Clostridia bacterium]
DEEIMQNLMATYDETTKAYALYVDSELLCAVKNENDIDSVLDEYKNTFDVGKEGETISFEQNVEIKHEYVPIAYLCTKDGVLNAITRTKEEEEIYIVQDKDTIWDIAVKYGMSVDELMSINPEINDLIKEGDKLKLNKSVPKLQVKVSYTETVDQIIPYENEKVNDDTMRKGLSEVVVQGSEGLKKVTQEVVILDGQRIACNVINEEVVTEAVNGKVKIGTKIVSGYGTGNFSRPASGTITARFGSRSSRWSSGKHTGLDIAAASGSPIYAADSGKVTFAGWKGSYGYMVILNHGNGYETYYAHCSKLCVSVGETVEKGDLIARVGSTGNSTGAHCHFEVRYNGVAKNPEAYLR